MSLSVAGQTGKIDVRVGGSFKVSVNADAVPLANGYVLVQAWLNWGATGLTFDSSATTWGDCNAADVGGSDAENANRGCLTGLLPASQFGSVIKGELFSFSLSCPAEKGSHAISLLPSGTAPAGTSGAQFTEFSTNTAIVPSVSGVDINCINAPTDTPTATPPPIPRMSKSPAIANHFLVRQGAKIPPADCLSGTGTTLSEGLSQDIVSPDPKNPSVFQQLGAFEFEVHYDDKKVCINLTIGEAFTAAGAVCIIEDAASKPQLEGVARIGCVTVGKGHDIDELVALASVGVFPQPEVYSQAKPNQDNGVVVQINNVNCDLSDEQGHAIPIFSCDDADITFRYLEGDVEPDCVIDAVDAQAIAFRWGVEKGSLIYKDFLNLEPSSQQADNDIDINDLQFVFGRFGSECPATGTPHPDQPPVNPKA
jgi:hypothetical protein